MQYRIDFACAHDDEEVRCSWWGMLGEEEDYFSDLEEAISACAMLAGEVTHTSSFFDDPALHDEITIWEVWDMGNSGESYATTAIFGMNPPFPESTVSFAEHLNDMEAYMEREYGPLAGIPALIDV